MPETNIVQGQIKVLGLIYAGTCVNTIVTLFDEPANWFMRQFVSQQEMEEFAAEHSLSILYKE